MITEIFYIAIRHYTHSTLTALPPFLAWQRTRPSLPSFLPSVRARSDVGPFISARRLHLRRVGGANLVTRTTADRASVTSVRTSQEFRNSYQYLSNSCKLIPLPPILPQTNIQTVTQTDKTSHRPAGMHIFSTMPVCQPDTSARTLV